MSDLMIRRYRQFLAAIVIQAVCDGDHAWLRSDRCQEILDLIGIDLVVTRCRTDLDPQRIGHAFSKSLTARNSYPSKN
jgi:hypothetical protein